MFEVVGLEKCLSKPEAAQAIKQLFSVRRVLFYAKVWEECYEVDLSGNLTAVPDDIDDYTGVIIVETEEDASEFSTRITLYRTAEADHEARELYIAAALARRFACRAITKCPEGMTAHPYCSLIVEPSGRMFEADDCFTTWGDGEGGPVPIMRPVTLPVVQFDAVGNLVS